MKMRRRDFISTALEMPKSLILGIPSVRTLNAASTRGSGAQISAASLVLFEARPVNGKG